VAFSFVMGGRRGSLANVAGVGYYCGVVDYRCQQVRSVLLNRGVNMARPFKPEFTLTCDLLQPHSHTPPYETIFDDEACACWFSGGRVGTPPGDRYPVITAQVAMAEGKFTDPLGWIDRPPKFDVYEAYVLRIHTGLAEDLFLHPVYGGLMWHGKAEAHCRFDCCVYNGETQFFGPYRGNLASSRYDQIDEFQQGREVTVDLYRPFGSASPVTSAIPAYIYPGTVGPASASFAFSFPDYDNIIIFDDTVDVRDGNLRTVNVDGVQYLDGDELRVLFTSTSSRYVVVRVERFINQRGQKLKRVFLLRHAAVWPGP
jgi:hypothetical protein